MKFSACIKSMRLRTLPLSLAGVMMGISVAMTVAEPSVETVVFLLLTTCSLQVLSNLSNELGDILNGTDTDQRQGLHYSIQDGEMSMEQMKKLIATVIGCCCVFGVLMIRFAFGTLLSFQSILFVVLGALAIIAAMRYTLGRNPYGYRGLGDLFVFVFFGLVSTLGAFYICCHDILAAGDAVLPACAMGCFSVAVLNVNNIRDMKTDAKTRVTVALKLGALRARRYQTILICAGWICMVVNTVLTASSWASWLYLVTLPLYVLHVRGVLSKDGRALDPMLPLLVMSTFLLSLLSGISRIFF